MDRLAEERVDVAFITRRRDDGPAPSLSGRVPHKVEGAVWIDTRRVRPLAPHNLMEGIALVQMVGGNRKRTGVIWELVESVVDIGEEWAVSEALKPVSS